ncbi:protein bric-a-brac 2-like isoform X2 [Neocloeon triangulifer]|uniref:protein bric-a-brac 2-like isoform X2 n=1 Tax=Neocloeon triangulifer TaxID=2078957 RepID=UPI00286FA89D|nr:protein bric-a-brac 2-like isoform X2 [Neocloeon triangulifer]
MADAIKPAPTPTRFVVQWEEHPAHLASRLGHLLESQTLVDITLMCNTHTLRVHRCVLAACSPYFENLLQNIAQRQLSQHPLIVLKDMQFSVLKSMIEFMYCGETNVTDEDLGPLLQAARFFQVKGLSSMSKEALGITSKPTRPKVNGDVQKEPAKAATQTVKSAASKVTSQLATPTKQTIQADEFRESPGLKAADLLLSLNKPVVAAEQKPMGAAKDSTLQLVPNQVGTSSPLYQKRGRPIKQDMGLMYQEKIVADTDVALRKEAEASKRAVESLQKQMNEDAEKKAASPQKSGGLVMKSTLVRIPPNQASAVKKGAAAAAAATAAQAAQEKVVAPTPPKETKIEKADDGDQITLQLNEGEAGTAMSNYEEVLKAAGLPADMPILMDSGDGNYVPISEEVLMNMVNSGVIQVQEESTDGGEVQKETVEEGGTQMIMTEGEMGQQIVQYIDDNGDLVEGVLAVVQEGEEGTTVAVTPSGEVLQLQAGEDGESFQLVEQQTESHPSEGELITPELNEDDSGIPSKKMKLDG